MINDFGWLLVEAGTCIFELILIITFLRSFLDEKELSIIRKTAVYICTFLMFFLVSSFLYDIPYALISNSFLAALFISFTLYKGKISQHLITSALVLAILAAVELLSVCIFILLLRINADSVRAEPMYKLIAVILKNILSYTAIKIICAFKKSNVNEINKKYFAFMLIVPVISTGVTLIMFEIVFRYHIENISSILAAALGLMYVNVIVFTIFEGFMRQMDNEYKYKIIEKQLELQLTHYNKLAENRAAMFEAIHDFKNHLNCIYNLHKYGKGNEIESYIENLINVSDSRTLIDTGHPVIDALLSDKYNIAQKIGIDFKKELSLTADISIAPADICAILGNSLDNAIEACKRMKNVTMKREIILSMICRESHLIIVVSNTIDQIPEKEGKYFRSSKPSPELHGLGMHSIERTVKKYSGNMVVKCDQGQFKLEIVMPTA